MENRSGPSIAVMPRASVTFCNADGRCAVIDYHGDVVIYSGDLPVDQSAKLLFDALGGHLLSARRREEERREKRREANDIEGV